MSPSQSIQALIDRAEKWRAQHIAAGRGIEAAACAIRIKALKDALAETEKTHDA